ncbi:hypothetical protein [Noviherbaspirillum denitrificans]|uniref:hypothetical protein n=1 Tax=Noviherbaspirillum denitrificans TaxID=1968433 RepID=UPI001131A3C6|nr:hypothetical protein [Noviherbaspirillum denitrificans]
MKRGQFLLEQLLRLSPGTTRHYPQPLPTGSDAPVDVQHEIRTRRGKGESFHEIAVALNRLGARGPYGGRWYANSVRATVRTPPG